MSDALARLRRLRPDLTDRDLYRGHYSDRRQDPKARAALVHVLHHMEIYADCFWRRDVIEAALRVAPPEVTAFRIAADLQRLINCHAGVWVLRRRGEPRDGGGQKLITHRASDITFTVAADIDDALGEDVFLTTRSEALERLQSGGGGRYVVLTPNRRATSDLAVCCGVEAIPARRWIAIMDHALAALENPEPLWRYWNRRTLVVDRAWTLFNVDILLILELCRQLCMDVILVDDVGRFRLFQTEFEMIYNRRRMPPVPRRRGSG